ncbi:MAG: Cysteine desulfurase IscS [Chlamydiia bacterium]|nr:Cysteine desulfurase IscS [Chlamydiia bacterium]MCH9616195.1 Cysteine desulfurase IscS [Chlamydiia bacterium]MCH9629819.1 Cysteine desulfurase IscS [Chlamydiia bacterium]
MEEGLIYLDHSTTTKPLKSQEGVSWQSLHAPYRLGKEPSDEPIRQLMGLAENDRFIFTSSGAEAISTVFLSKYLDDIRLSGKNHIIVPKEADVTIYKMAQKLEDYGCSVSYLETNDKGQISPEIIADAITPRTGLISLGWANGLTGVVHPIWDIANLAEEKGIELHVDASNILGKLFFRFSDMPITYLTFDGDLIYAPKGTGGLCIKETSPLKSLIPDSLFERGGTQNLQGLADLSYAAAMLSDDFDRMCTEIAYLRDHLEKLIGEDVLFQETERLPNVTAIIFPGIAHELLLYHAIEEGLYATFGGGRMQRLPRDVLSFALGRETTADEIEKAASIINALKTKLTPLSEALL